MYLEPGQHFSNMYKFLVPEILDDRKIDFLYIQGNVSDKDYGNYYLDPTRAYIPNYITENIHNLPKAFQETLRREKVVQNKNLILHNMNMTTKFFEQ